MLVDEHDANVFALGGELFKGGLDGRGFGFGVDDEEVFLVVGGGSYVLEGGGGGVSIGRGEGVGGDWGRRTYTNAGEEKASNGVLVSYHGEELPVFVVCLGGHGWRSGGGGKGERFTVL